MQVIRKNCRSLCIIEEGRRKVDDLHKRLKILINQISAMIASNECYLEGINFPRNLIMQI